MNKRYKSRSCDELEIVVAKTREDIEKMRPVWEKMQAKEPYPVINADIDRFLCVIEASGDSVRPCIILIKQNGQPRAMVIGRVEKHLIELKLGYKTLLSPKLRCLIVVYGGILGQPGEEVCSLLVDKFVQMLSSNETDVVLFNHLAIDSKIYYSARSMPNFFCRGHFPVQHLHWKTILPSSYEEFLCCRSKNSRHNIRRYSKRLVSKYGNRLSIRCFTETNQIDHLFFDTDQVAKKTYQYGLGSGFINDIKTRRLFRHFLDRKCLIAYVLYIDGKPCAFWNGVRYGKTFFTWTTGYDPAYYDDRLGLFLLTKVFDALCLDLNVDAVDFGFGDAQYKQSFCDLSWTEASVYIFAPRLYPTFINMLRTSATGLNTGLEYLLNKTAFAGWIKRRWRNLLQAKSVESRLSEGR